MSDKQIIIRPLRPTDAHDLYEIASDPAVNRTMIMLPSMEFSATEAWIENKQDGRYRLVAEVEERVVGSCTMTLNQRPRMQHSAVLGLMVHRDYWGMGVGSALMAAQMDLADNWLNVARVELEVFADNPAAIRLYEKFGFVIEGTRRLAMFGGNGRYHDEHIMARINETRLRRQPPSEPPPMPALAPPIADVVIRPVHPDDAADMHDLWRHPLVARTTLQMPSMSFVSAADRVQGKFPDIHRFVAEGNGRILGAASLHQHTNPRSRHVGGLGMMVHPHYWGQGIGHRLMAAVMDIADNWLGLRRVELEVHTDNPAAIRLYQKFDFEIEGTKRFHSSGDGRWADAHFMAKITE